VSRFVILAHEKPDGVVHYDLMIEIGGDLRTWCFAEPPGSCAVTCRRLFDHPRRFLNYEGPLSEGRGRVRRHDIGFCHLEGGPGEALTLELRGRAITGTFRLTPAADNPDPTQRGKYLWQPAD